MTFRNPSKNELEMILLYEKKRKRREKFKLLISSYKIIMTLIFNILGIIFFYIYFKEGHYKNSNFYKWYAIIFVILLIIIFFNNIKIIYKLIKYKDKNTNYIFKVVDVKVNKLLYYDKEKDEYLLNINTNNEIYALVKDESDNENYVKLQKPYIYFNENEEVLLVKKEFNDLEEVYLIKKV